MGWRAVWLFAPRPIGMIGSSTNRYLDVARVIIAMYYVALVKVCVRFDRN